MALKKKIKNKNDIELSYHRIVSLNKITNQTNILEVASYIDGEQRQIELDYYNSTDPNKYMNVFIDTSFLNCPYDETKTIEEYYDYLKTTEKFKDAEDV